MKKLIITSILAVLAAAGTIVRAQDWHEEYLGLPGDNLNLYAVMNLFQESRTLEEFEAKLNAKDSRINNLDLNGDNFIDYITVNDYVEGKIHTIVLRAVLGRDDFQDVAVFIVERKNRNKVRIQLIGDEMLYGRNYVIEPRGERPNPGYRDNLIYVGNVYYYDLSWPLLDWMFMPSYVAWHSRWYWGYWPAWWEPWSPWYWHYYYGFHYNWYPYYRAHFHYWNHPPVKYYNTYYSHERYHSMNVARRETEGHYKQTYSRPELVSQGEALYRTVDTRRAEDRAAAAAEAGRSTPVQSSNGRASTSVDNDRRSSAVVNNRSRVSTRDAETTGSRTTTQTRNSSETRPAATVGNETSRRETATVPDRNASAARENRSSAERSSIAAPVTSRSTNATGTNASRSTGSRSSSSSAEVRSSTASQRSTTATQRSSTARESSSNKSSSNTATSPRKSSSSVKETRSSTDKDNTTSSRRK